MSVLNGSSRFVFLAPEILKCGRLVAVHSRDLERLELQTLERPGQFVNPFPAMMPDHDAFRQFKDAITIELFCILLVASAITRIIIYQQVADVNQTAGPEP